MKNKKLIVEAITDQAYEIGCKNIIAEMQRLYDLGMKKGLNAQFAADAVGVAMRSFLKTAQRLKSKNYPDAPLSTEDINWAFAESVSDTDAELRLKSVQNSAMTFLSQNLKVFNHADLKELANSKTKKGDIVQMCIVLHQSQALKPLIRDPHTYVKGGRISTVYDNVMQLKNDLAKEHSTVKRIFKQLFYTGLMLNISNEMGIDINDDKLIEKVLEKLFQIKEKGLSDEQVDIIYESECRQNGFRQRNDIKSSWGEMNFVSYLKLFSNRWYGVYKAYIAQKSMSDENAILAKTFLEKYNETPKAEQAAKFKGITVKCSPETLFSLSMHERDIILPRLAVSSFKKLEYHTQLERVQAWDKHERNIVGRLLDESEQKTKEGILKKKFIKGKTESKPKAAKVEEPKHYSIF
jgi:hypothetical protein